MIEEKKSSRPAPGVVELGIAAIEEIEPNVLETGDSSNEGEIAPLDYPQGADRWGTTAFEQHRSEPLEQRYLHEQSQNGPSSFQEQVPPFSEANSDFSGGFFDLESEQAAEQDFELEDTLAPEESAMHFEDESK